MKLTNPEKCLSSEVKDTHLDICPSDVCKCILTLLFEYQEFVGALYSGMPKDHGGLFFLKIHTPFSPFRVFDANFKKWLYHF